MALSKLNIEGIGEVNIFRRKGLKYLRISVNREGRVRLSIPWYVPQSAAIKYLETKKDWVKKHRRTGFTGWTDGQKLTSNYTLKVHSSDGTHVTHKIESPVFHIFVPDVLGLEARQSAVNNRVKVFLKTEAEKELVPLLHDIAKKGDFKVTKVRVKNLKSRWGSCSHERAITLNASLVQLPSHLVEYVICHELAHTRHLNHGDEFWQEVTSMLSDYKKHRRELRQYNPAGIS